MSRGPKQYSLAMAPAGRPRRLPHKPFVPGPNPELPEFIAAHSTPYDPATDRYDVPAFDRDLVVDKAHPPKAIYDMHTYWSKKHWAAVREYIRHYLPEKYYSRGTGLVLDCFSGSGMTGVATMMEDRPCVLIDASPAAAFISHSYTHPVDPDELREAYDRMMTEDYPAGLRLQLQRITGVEIRNLQQELDWLYETRCDRCNGPATTEYVVYSERFQCPACAEIVPLYDCQEFAAPKKGRYCPHCVARRRGEAHRDCLISTRSRKFGSVPVLVSYKCLGGCKPARDQRSHAEDQRTRKGRFFHDYDLAKIPHIQQAHIPHWYPDRKFLRGYRYQRDALWNYGVDTVADLYTKRNLWALAAVVDCLPAKRLGALLVNMAGMNVSRMRRHREGGGGQAAGTYYIPQINREQEPTDLIMKKLKAHIAVSQHLSPYAGKNVVSCGSAIAAPLPLETIDYIFTDPSYVHKVQYGELNFVWESWLGFTGDWLKDEIVVNPFRNKTIDDWDRDLRTVLAKCFAALKPGRWLSLCYHDTDPGTWTRVQDMLLDTGFEIHTVTVLDPKQKSSNQLTGEKVVKSDLVLNCRKPRPGESRPNGAPPETELVSNRVREIILETLSKTGGQARDRLWDIVLKRLLTRGQMAEHRFDDILAEVAFRSELGRWFLKEEFETLSQSDLRNEEEAGAALDRFARLRCIGVPVEFAAHIALKVPELAGPEALEGEVERFVKTRLIDDPTLARNFALGGRMKGIEFYDCLFFYLTRFLKGRAAGQMPRRNLAEFLEEYLVRFREGDKWLYKPPNPVQAEGLQRSRQTGLGRRIRQFAAFLRGEGDLPKERIPDAKTLVAWLKHCSAFGLADEGVLLFERGGLAGEMHALSADAHDDAEEYYQTCKRKASRPVAAEEEDEATGEEG